MKHPLARAGCLFLCLCLLLVGCNTAKNQQSPAASQPEAKKFSTQFFGTFDTVIQVVGYAPDQAAFQGHAQAIQERFGELSRLYDRFYAYDGVNNIHTINQNAGVAPVVVAPEILDLLEITLERYHQVGGTNIALGPVLDIWHDYIGRYSGTDPASTQLPPQAELEAASQLCNPDNILLDREASTVFLTQPGMMLDLGAVAKGYAAQVVADEAYARGFTSFIISAGGNVVAMDPPQDGVRKSWPIGIQDPFADPNDPKSESLDVVMVTHQSVVTSGDYQRFYMHGDQRIHHIIDPMTLQPANHYRAMTVVCDDSGEADYASTCLFVLPYEESRAMAERMGWKALWVFPDGEIAYTDSMLPQLRDRGGATAAVQP